MAPGVHNQEQEDKDTQDEEHDRRRLGLPKRMDVLLEFIQTHATLIYTSLRKRENDGSGQSPATGLIDPKGAIDKSGAAQPSRSAPVPELVQWSVINGQRSEIRGQSSQVGTQTSAGNSNR